VARAAVHQADHARGDHQGLAGSGEGVAERVDGRPVHRGGGGHAAGGEVGVAVAEVDHAVGVGRRGPQAVEVVQVAAAGLGAESGHLGGGRVRAGQADDLVAGLDELGDGGRADPAGCAGDEDAHVEPPVMSLDDIVHASTVMSWCDMTRIMSWDGGRETRPAAFGRPP
jgi:hypothetical protein